MASKSGQETASSADIEELLDAVDSTLDRLKTLYEQYFLGIQKQAPAYIHSDVERKLRDLTQINIRNTGLRYRLATLQQKFGSYNSYWRRTLRQIENGTYVRNLAKIGREAARNGADIPEEILAAMPKRMREQVLRDRDQALAIAKRRKQLEEGASDGAIDADGIAQGDAAADAATEAAPAPAKPAAAKTRGGAHILSEDDGDIDFNALFSAFEDDAPKAERAKQPTAPPQPVARPQLPRMPLPTEPPRAAAATPSAGASAVPRPIGAQPSTSTGVPRAIGQQPSPATGAVPHPAQSPSGPAQSATGPVPVAAPQTATGAIPRPVVPQPASGGVPRPVGPQPSGSTGVPRATPTGIPRPQTGPVPVPPDASRPTPTNVPRPQTGPMPAVPRPPAAAPSQPVRSHAPSQQSRPIPVMPGSAAQTGPVPVESMSGPFPREKPAAPAAARPQQSQPIARVQPVPAKAPTTPPAAKPPLKPPPGMTEADVNALHAKYVKAKEMVGEKVDAGSREKLLKTITQTAPKIMEQYKSAGVDFSVVVKDNQVIIKAKPKG